MLQKSSSLIDQLAIVHICDMLTNVKKIYEPSCLRVHGRNDIMTNTFELSLEKAASKMTEKSFVFDKGRVKKSDIYHFGL